MFTDEFSKKKRQLLKEFIQLYESFPCLWDLKSKDYRNREMRARAYRVLSKKLQQVHPNADRSTVVRKINCLRSNLRKEKRKTLDCLKAGKVYETKLWYYPYFGFLEGKTRWSSNEAKGLEVIVTGVAMKKEEEGKSSDPLEWQCDIDDDSHQEETYPSHDTEEDDPVEPRYEVETLRISHPGPSKEMSANHELIKDTARGQQEDRHDVFGNNVAMKLRHISSVSDTQRIMAEKIINEALYLGEMGLLTMEHCRMLK